MERETAVDWFVNKVFGKNGLIIYDKIIQEAKEIEKQQMKDAVLYGLDEDGHTGDWKVSVAEDYYIKTYTK
jgi:hypothetical protein